MQLFTGKGGVGKSTAVAACAIGAAQRGLQPLVVELGHRGTMQTLFGAPVTGTPSEVWSGDRSSGGGSVHAMRIDEDEALVEFVDARTKLGALVRRPTLARFFHAAPAVQEVVALDVLTRLEASVNPRWHPILVDLDSTGHALMFLSLPEVFEGLASRGPLRKMLDGFTALLRDERRTALHLVTLPAELPLRETVQLHTALTDTHRVALGALIVDRAPARRFDEADLERVSELDASDAALVRRDVDRHERAGWAIARLRALSMPTVVLPERLEQPPDLLALAEAMWA